MFHWIKKIGQRREDFSSVFFYIILLCLLFLLSSCTDYERAGLNPRPFNEPTYWEINPYGANAFQN